MHFDLRDILRTRHTFRNIRNDEQHIHLMEISSLVVLTEPPSLPVMGWLPLGLGLDGSSIILLRFIAGCICCVQVEDRISRSLFQGLGVLLRWLSSVIPTVRFMYF